MGLPTVQKHWLLQPVSRWHLILFLFVYSGLSQQSDSWLQLYRSHQIYELKRLNESGAITDPHWRAFIEALFMDAADSAIARMAGIYFETTDAGLKEVIRQRIGQYYYARGYYETARRIQMDEAFVRMLLAGQQKKTRYGVQIGAFLHYENALKFKRKWEDRIRDVKVINKIRNGSRLYVVVAGGFRKREDAERLKEQLRSEFSLKGYIVQY
ncbi:MAG: SPOR domain-containing protein [Calditrichaeota bacterium]|nr:SPOR domain-containing protein [Calditrichota bacterium]